MKRTGYFFFSLLLLQVLTVINLKAQTTLLSPTVNNGGFESGTSGWTFAQTTTGTNDNRWEVGGNSTPYSGSNAAYITTGAAGLPYSYSITTTKTSHMYRDVTFPSGETTITFNFYLKGAGETGWDRLLVYIAPTSVTPVAGTPASSSTTLTGATRLYTQATYYTNYTLVSVAITAAQAGNTSANSTMRLIFTWQGDNSYGSNPPASVDNITLTTSCSGASATSASSITTTGATLNWSTFSGATGYSVRYKKATDPTSVTTWATPTSVSGGSTTSLAVSSLTSGTLYEYQVAAVGACPVFSASSLFSTGCSVYSLTRTENFDVVASSTTPPPCWSTTTLALGTSTAPAITYETSGTNATCSPYQGARMVKFNSYDCNDGAQIRLNSPQLNTSIYKSIDVTFYWLNDNSAWTSDHDSVRLQYSTNSGSSWTNAGPTFDRLDGTTSPPAYNLKSVTLPAAAAGVSNLMVGFLFKSDYGNNCYMDSIAIKPTPPQAPNAVSTQRCGAGNATCSVTTNNGWSSNVYAWYTQAVGGTAISSQTGASLTSYSISATTTFYVSEFNGDAESPRTAVTCTVNPLPSASITSTTDPICYGASTGSATAAGSGGTSPYTYSWTTTPVQTSATATNLAANSYTVTVTDNKTCQATAIATINNPSINTLTTVSTQPSSSTICSGTNTSFTAGGTGLGTMSYQWWVNPGSGFVALTDGGIYSGSATATLSLTNATGAYTGYIYRCVVTGTCNSATSNNATLTVNAFTPSVSVSANPGTTVCQSVPITFTANPVNGGSAPSYQWSVDGTAVTGATNSTFITSTLSPGFHGIRVTMTSNQACTFPLTVQSSGSYFVNIIASVTPTISIAESPNDTVCAGASVTFTPTITNGGSGPSYQWKINGTNVATSTTFNTTGLANNDVVSCVLTSNANCRTSNTVNSNNITMTVNPIVTPLLTISTSNSTICSGDQMTFNTTPTYPGTAPAYQWKVNGNNVGTNSPSFTMSGFSNNDVVSCVMTSNFACVVPPTANSNNINVTVLQRPVPALDITASPDTNICTGTLVSFSTNPVNGGTTPTYQWQLNGVDMTGATSSTYAAGVLNSGDIISCVLNSSAACATPQIVTSNNLKFTVTPSTPPTIYISAKKGNIINEGDTITVNALVVNGGATPTYTWKKNGDAIAGATGSTLITSDLQNNDQITLTVHSSSVCANPDSGTSNSITILIGTGVGDHEQALRDVKLYPNPNTGRFTIEAKLGAQHSEKEAAIEILNNLGQLVYRGTAQIASGEIRKEVELNGVASGTYFVRMSVGDEFYIDRFIVQ